MPAEKSPAFQFYPRDFLSDSNVIVMSLQERGAYITLLCHCWNDGSLPNEPERLARLCGVPVTMFRRLWPAIAPCFRLHPEEAERLVHPRLEKERAKQITYAAGQRESGKRGAAKRWAGKSDGEPMATPSPSNGKPIISPMAKNSSSSASASADPLPKNGSGGACAPSLPPRTDSIIGRRNPDLFTYGPVKLWASQFRDEILPLVATHFGGDRDAADKPARAWIAELDEQNQRTTPSRDAISKPAKWWSERAAERWGAAQSVVDDPWLRGGRAS